MENQHYIYLNRKAVLAAMITAAFPMGLHAAAGKVEFASGGATIQSADGISKPMFKGMEISQGDTILTGAGRAQVKFSDGGYISFQPNTQFKIEEYNYNGKQDGSERGFFRLVEGGLRALTGLVGRENRPNYRMATPVATIGIRGSYYLAEFHEKLRTHVGHGSIYVFNEQGNIILFEGQGATVEPGKAPGYSDEDLTLGARGPEGAKPEDTNNEQQAENENNDIFKVSEQYADNGISTSIDNISAVIANLNGINAEGVYVLDDNVAQKMGSNSTGSIKTKVIDATLYVNFGNYTIGSGSSASPAYSGFDSSHISVAAVSGGSTYGNTTFNNISGSILSGGSFTATGSTSSSGAICNSTCTMNVIGFFSGPQAEKGGIGYSIKGDVNGGSPITGGAAGIKAVTPPAPGGFVNYYNFTIPTGPL